MAAPFYDFKSFFKPIDQQEADALITDLPPIGIGDIWELLSTRSVVLGSDLDTRTHVFSRFWSTLLAEVTTLYNSFTVVDIDNPTNREKAKINTLLPSLLSKFHPYKAEAILKALELVDANSDNIYNIFKSVTRTSETTAASTMDASFYGSLAQYYLRLAQEYVAAHSRSYQFIGRVIDSVSQEGVGAVKVSLNDENLSTSVKSYGHAKTNDDGYYRIDFKVLEGISGVYPLDLTFHHPGLSGSPSQTLNFDPSSKDPIVSSLNFTAQASSSNTIASTGITIPNDLQTYLTSIGQSVTRLDQIRHLGGFKNLPTDSINKNDPALLKLDGLASLEVVQADLAKNDTLYARGYDGATAIGLSPLDEFISTNTDLFGDLGAAQIHHAARAAHGYGVNALASGRTPMPDHTGTVPDATGGASACNCPDCRSAVSPLAYLADLVVFIKNHLRHGTPGTPIYFPFLNDNLFQPFADLRTSCDQLKEKVCQNRIAAEVIRAYYATLAGSPNATVLAADREEYLAQTYELLLTRLGTSYSELRMIRGSSEEDKQRLAKRLRLVYEHNSVLTLEELFVDLSDPTSLVEGVEDEGPGIKSLEGLFGLRDTNRGPLDETPTSKVETWLKAKLQQDWIERDGFDHDYWQLSAADRNVIIDPDIVTVDDLREPIPGNTAFDIWKKRKDWVDLVGTKLDGPYQSSFPLGVLDADFAKGVIIAYGAELPTLSQITYDSNQPGPFTAQFNVLEQFIANGNTYFRIDPSLLGEDRYNGTIESTAPAVQHANIIEGRNVGLMLEYAIDGMEPYPSGGADVTLGWSGSAANLIADIRANITSAGLGSEEDIAALQAMHLDVASASRLVELYDKNQEAPDAFPLEGNLTPDEWNEVKNILIAAGKKKLSESGGLWRSEEVPQLMGPHLFWNSMSEPKVGTSAAPVTSPLIDPDHVTSKDLPEITARHHYPLGSDNVLVVLEDRRDDLQSGLNALMSAHSTGFQELLNDAFGVSGLTWDPTDPNENDYLILLNSLADDASKGWSELYIAHRLKLSEADLRTVITFGTEEDEGVEHTDADTQVLYSILLRSKKLLQLYPVWITEESQQARWKLRKALLPKWRATPEQRKAWLEDLAENRKSPIIDPDLIGPGDLKTPEAGNAAHDLWDVRWQSIHGSDGTFEQDGTDGWLFDVNVALTDHNDLDTLTAQHLGHVESSLNVLRVQQEEGIDIRLRLKQLDLTASEFVQLLYFRDILSTVPAGPILDQEVEIIKRILTAVRKRRQAYIFRLEEVIAGITLSPDHFRIRESGIGSFPAQSEYPLKPWLAEERDLIQWRRELKSRIEAEKHLHEDWQNILFEVDEAMVVHLRDAYVKAAGDPAKNLIENARALGDQLLIDLENNCCYKTNRVAAAIETLQQLIWKTHTKDILVNYQVRYEGGNFDEAWTWIGSYANWRAAIFVFLYPENVLHPSLRRDQTPAFKEVIEATRNNRRFGPTDACEVAHKYKEYIADVSDLEVICSQQATCLVGDDHCGSQNSAFRKLTFIFAQARGSKRPYFTIIDNNDRDKVMQTDHWILIPSIPDEPTLRGCDLYVNWDERIDHIYLFYTLKGEENKAKFFALRYALQTMNWEEEALEFEVEQDDLINEFSGILAHTTTTTQVMTGWNNDYNIFGGATQDNGPIFSTISTTNSHNFAGADFDVSIRALCLVRNTYAWQPPTVTISAMHKSGQTFCFSRSVAVNGKELASKEIWDKWMTKFYYAIPPGSTTNIAPGPGDEVHVRSQLQGLILDSWSYHPPNTAWDWKKVLTFYLIRNENNMEGTVTKIIRKCIGFDTNERYDLVAYTNSNLPNDLLSHLFHDAEQDRLLAFAATRDEVSDGLSPTKVITFPPEVFQHVGSNDVTGTLLPAATSVDVPSGSFKLVPVQCLPDQGTAAGDFRPFLYQRVGDDRLFLTDYSINSGTQQFEWGDDLIQIAPRFHAQPVIGPAGNSAQQSEAMFNSWHSWLRNQDGNIKNLDPIEEAFYFVPMQIALQLQVNGHYQKALDWFRSVYDFRNGLTDRKISFLLRQEENLGMNEDRVLNWYMDPLNPHAIASLRKNTYTRYTLLAIIYCLLDYADAEFTTDNSETVPRARELYEDVLQLLKLLVPSHDCSIAGATGLIEEHDIPGPWVSSWTDALEQLEPLSGSSGFDDLISQIDAIMDNSDPIAEQLADVNDLIATALAQMEDETVETTVEGHTDHMNAATTAALGSVEADSALLTVAQSATGAFTEAVVNVTGISESELATKSLPWLAKRGDVSPFPHEHAREYFNPNRLHQLREFGEAQPARAFDLNFRLPNVWLSGVPLLFCAVPNPIAGALLMKAEVQLFKIHNCMNIAGMVRELEPFAAPTDSTSGIPMIGAAGGTLYPPNANSYPPSAYRYRTLVERAKQLVAMAQQVEAAFLNSLEKADAENYAILRADQDITTSKASIKLQDLKINEANGGVSLAMLQRDRAKIQRDFFDARLDEGLIAFEKDALLLMKAANLMQLASSVSFTSASVASLLKPNELLSNLGNAFSSIASGLSSQAQLWQQLASYERRKQDWEFQRSLANQDVLIGDQQVNLAKDRVRIVNQEREIAVLQNDHAKATFDFLKNKFTNAELYEWMSRILEDVYAWFLQEATAMAMLAQRQLVFERQVDLPPFILSDYWIMDTGTSSSLMANNGTVDRRGMTGSARLLKDLHELDQYAFVTNSPKLQLSKTISLNEIAPEQLVELRRSGIASFRTTHNMFDRDYPGHYLRLIKKVNVTVIALNSPTKGIRATLTNGGISRVWTGGTFFQERVIERYPELIALSSGVGDHGMFNLRPDGEFLDPFEGSGVDTLWEFRMEKAANPFDFNSIADVLVTIEYEALHDPVLRKKVADQLSLEGASAAIALSLKNNLPDQWYDLHNPSDESGNYEVTFEISERDLAVNINESMDVIRAVAMVIMKDGASFNYEIGLSKIAGEGYVSVYDGFAILSGATSTPPKGTWYLGFNKPSPLNPEDPFANDQVEDVIIVLTYQGQGVAYTS